MKRRLPYRVPLLAFACILAAGLPVRSIHAGAPPATATGATVCVPFENAANAQKKIPRSAYEKIAGDFKQPAKEPVPPKKAAAVYLSAMIATKTEIAPWQWRGIKESIDSIYKKKILAYTMAIDVNNDGSTETVIEFVPSPVLSPFNYVLDEHGRLNQDFLGSGGRPTAIDGKLVTFENKTYLLTAWGTAAYEDGRPSEQVMDVYSPRKSPMQAKGGIAEHGAGPLCEYKILNKNFVNRCSIVSETMRFCLDSQKTARADGPPLTETGQSPA